MFGSNNLTHVHDLAVQGPKLLGGVPSHRLSYCHHQLFHLILRSYTLDGGFKVVLCGVVDGTGFFFFLPYVLGKLLLDVEELDEVVHHLVEDLVFIDSDELLFLFRHRLGRGGCGLSSKELEDLPDEAVYFFSDGSNFFSGLFNLNELRFRITVKLATLLDVFDQSRC